VAQYVPNEVHCACAEPVASPSKQDAAKMASPNDFQYDMNLPPTYKALKSRALRADHAPKSDRPIGVAPPVEQL
jgi:hypothetical protein